MPSEEDIVQKLREFLGQADLSVVTVRHLRNQLEEHFKEDMSGYKSLIRSEAEKFIAAHAPAEEEEEEEGDAEAAEDEEDEDDEKDEDHKPDPPKKRRKSSGGGMGSTISPELQEFLGAESVPRTEVVKELWKYIKAHDLQDPANKRKILLDDKLATLFTNPLTMFSINKQLSRHFYASDTPAARKRKAVKEDGDDDGSAKKSGFNKEYKITEEMSKFLGGKNETSRPELTRAFWKYVKEHDLQDPSNKQYILCDNTLKALLKEDRIHGMSFQKYVKDHFLD